MRTTVFTLIALVLASSGCGNQSSPAPKATSNASASTTALWTDEEKRIAEIARKAVGANNSFFEKQSEVRKPFKQTDGSWAVVIWPLPAMPGGQTYVDIDANGKVMSITGGK